MDSADPTPRPARRLLLASWPLLTVAGVRVRIHWTTALVPLAAFLALRTWVHPGRWSEMTRADVALWTAVATVLLCAVTWSHELAHVWAARSARVPVRSVTLWPLGGLGHIEFITRSPHTEIFVALAGPATHAVWFVGAGVPYFFGIQGTPAEATGWGTLVAASLVLNACFLVFNLLPFWPMDGGRVLRAAFALRMHPTHASLFASYAGFAGAVVVGLVGVAAILQMDSEGASGATGAVVGSFLIGLALWNFTACRRLLEEAHWRPEGPYASREPRPRPPPPAKWSLEEPTPAEPVVVEERRERRATTETAPRRREVARPAAPPLHERIDELLDRINEVGGIEKLSDAEKKELSDASDRLRRGDR